MVVHTYTDVQSYQKTFNNFLRDQNGMQWKALIIIDLISKFELIFEIPRIKVISA